MKKPFFLIIFCLIHITAWAQMHVVDSLKRELTQVHHDTTKIIMMCNLSINEGLEDFAERKVYALQALQKANEIGYEKGIGTAYCSLGMMYDLSYQLDSAILYYSKAGEKFKEVGFKKGEGYVYTGLGYVCMAKGDYGKAAEYAILGLKKREEINNAIDIGGSYVLLGNIFQIERGFNAEGNKSNQRKALKYYQQALELFKKEKSEINVGIVLTNIGGVYSSFNELDSALITYKKALSISIKQGNKIGIAIDHNNVGGAFRDLKKYDSALYYLLESNRLYMEMNHSQGRIIPLKSISRIYSQMGKLDQALDYAQETFNIAKALNNNIQLLGATKLMHEAFAQADSFKQAYDMLILHKSYADTVYDNKREQLMRDQELSYNVEKKEQQITDLEKVNELAQLRRNILITSLMAVVLIGFLLYNQQRLKSKKNQQLLEKEQEVDRVKSKFFANISHEFRTPLTLLIGPIDHIKESINDKQQLFFLDMMKRNAGKLLNQVNQLLDLSKLDSGQLKLDVVKMDSISFIKGIVMSFESLAATREVELSFFNKNDVSDFYADRDAIEKIVTNLVSNALKFTPSTGTVKVEVAAVTKSPLLASPIPAMELIVQDSGIGFDEELKEHIFDRYYHTESDLQASTGIGLALVKELVDSHFGVIDVNSQKGSGSTFKIHIPLGKDHWQGKTISEETVIKVEDDANSFKAELSNPTRIETDHDETVANQTILIIDDNDDVRSFILEILKDQFQILEASNGKEGISMAQEMVPDLIITDIMMPGLDGYEVTQQLKTDIHTSHIPVIMLTAKAGLENKLQGLETEADEYITKPFDARELIARVKNLIKSRVKLREQFGQSMLLKPNDISLNSIDAVFLDKVMVAIESNMDNANMSVEFLGEQIGMSRSQMYRKLQAITGHSPSQLIRDMRLTRSMELLKNNVGTVSEIGYMVGFNTPSYFSTCFHEKYGYAPGEVKKQYDPQSSMI